MRQRYKIGTSVVGGFIVEPIAMNIDSTIIFIVAFVASVIHD